MTDKQNNVFGKIKQSSSIDPNDIYKVAESVKGADFSDEKTVRKLVRHLSRMANKPVSKEKEDKLVKAITDNKMPKDIQSLNQMFNK